MKEYILSIAGAILLSTVISIISPSGKMGSFVKGMTKLVIVLIMISPFISWIQKGEFYFESAQISFDSTYLDVCSTSVSENIASSISNELKNQFYIEAQTSVELNPDGSYQVKNINVFITDFGISSTDEHINIIEEVKTYLMQTYSCEANVYERETIQETS